MRSGRVKLLHPLGGRPVVAHVLEAARSVPCRRIVAVVGVQAGDVRRALLEPSARDGGPAPEFCTQTRRLGTAHAVLAAERLLGTERGTLLILNGDVPLVRPETLRALLARHRRRRASLTLLTTTLDDPTGYGRIVRGADGTLLAVAEQADVAERADLEGIGEVNAGLYAAEMDGLFAALRATSRRNAQGEYYLPDLVQVLREAGRRVEAVLHPGAAEVLGVNTRADLARAARSLFRRKAEELMEAGVTLVDPDATYVDPEVRVGRDTVLHPMVRLEGRSRIGRGCVVHAGARISGSTLADGVVVLDHCLIVDAAVGRGARIGPFAHLRPGTVLGRGVHIGNFVETKKAAVADGAKANHLAYLGDAEIGRGVNVGAGTITCNYDGWEKHRTVLEDGVFIGSDTQLVAPVRVGRGAFVGAGSTITKDVPAGALAISRVRQQNVEGWAVRKRREMAARGRRPRRR
jgi:bifunctional UDP-N-acetylglucosamine pyrophosphorylase/glucosamine-1-phosphate N-acetyltransferase